MNTTSLLVEIIVIGAIALLWLIPLLLGVAPLQVHRMLQSNAPVVWVVGAANLYTLGLAVNFLSDRVTSGIQKVIVVNYGGKRRLQQARARILLCDTPAAEYLHQRRSIVRIFRATTLNALLIAIVWSVGSSADMGELWQARWGVVATAAALFVIAGWAFIGTFRGYCSLLADLIEDLDGKRHIS